MAVPTSTAHGADDDGRGERRTVFAASAPLFSLVASHVCFLDSFFPIHSPSTARSLAVSSQFFGSISHALRSASVHEPYGGGGAGGGGETGHHLSIVVVVIVKRSRQKIF